jgi:hypothetical protein
MKIRRSPSCLLDASGHAGPRHGRIKMIERHFDILKEMKAGIGHLASSDPAFGGEVEASNGKSRCNSSIGCMTARPAADTGRGRESTRPRRMFSAFACPGGQQCMGTADHRFALSRPALPSAPSKKSFSSVSPPVLAGRDFQSTAGAAGSGRAAAPAPPAAPSRSCAFHWGWAEVAKGSVKRRLMDNRRVDIELRRHTGQRLLAFDRSQSHFRLTAGAWFRRGRLLIVSPALRPFWPVSGRNSTYPAVQVCQAAQYHPQNYMMSLGEKQA